MSPGQGGLDVFIGGGVPNRISKGQVRLQREGMGAFLGIW